MVVAKGKSKKKAKGVSKRRVKRKVVKPKVVVPVLRKRIHVRSRQGLHARPAALFVQVANRFKSTIRIRKGKREVNGKSIMGLLTLASSKGSDIEVSIKGSDARDAMRAFEAILSRSDPPTVVTVLKHRPEHGASTTHH